MAPFSRKRTKRKRGRRTGAAPRNAAGVDRTAGKGALESAAAAASQTAGEFLRRDDRATCVVELADGTRKLALRVMQQSPLHGRHACQPGCAFCCHTAVTVAPPEAFAIAAYLKEHCSEEVLGEIRRRLDENAEPAASMSRDEYIARLVPCALLTEDGNCRAHAVRPIACAGFLSTSRAGCEAEFNRVPGREPVPADRFAMLAGLTVSNGLMEACNQAGVDGRFYELHHALRRVLDTPDIAEKWARGEDVFAGCLP